MQEPQPSEQPGGRDEQAEALADDEAVEKVIDLILGGMSVAGAVLAVVEEEDHLRRMAAWATAEEIDAAIPATEWNPDEQDDPGDDLWYELRGDR